MSMSMSAERIAELHVVSQEVAGRLVSGILLVFPTRELAVQPFDVLEDYFAGGRRSGFVHLSFERNVGADDYRFTWIIDSPNSSWVCKLDDVGESAVEDILASLKLLRYGFLFAGYRDEALGWKILHGCHYNYSQLAVNGAVFLAEGEIVMDVAAYDSIAASTAIGKVQ